MDIQVTIRLAEKSDAAALADLRWRLQTEDANEPGKGDFPSRFAEFMLEESSFVHWIAELNGQLIAAMSVERILKLPSPEHDGKRYWGYLTNCYTLPEYRNQGIGGSLLSRVKRWAEEEGLEFLAVWPSDRSNGFYEKAGFLRRPAPLVLKIKPK